MAKQIKDDNFASKVGRRLGLKKEIITKETFDAFKSKLKGIFKIRPQALTLKNKKKVIRVVMDIDKVDIGNGVVALIDGFTVNQKSKDKYQIFIDFRPDNGEWLKEYESVDEEQKQNIETSQETEAQPTQETEQQKGKQ